MVYMTAISSVSQASQGTLNVEMPTGKVCPVSLMTLTIAESGSRKSSVENLLSKGIKRFQKDTFKNHKIKLKRYKAKLEIYEKKVAQIKKSINLNDQAQCEEAVDRLLEHEELKPVKPVLPMLTFEDSTIEALLSALNGNIPNASLSSSSISLVI